MFGRHSGSYVENGSKGSSRGSSWREMRHKRDEDQRYKQEEEHSGPREGSFQAYQSMLDASRHERFDRRDEELERLRRLVKDLELEARGRRQKRNREEHTEGLGSVGSSNTEAPYQSGSHRHQDQSREYADRDSISQEG